MTDPGRRPTIDDVAREAGLSRQTVSNVLRHRGRVGAETRQRVLQIVDEMGYRPHAAARSLRSRRTAVIAYPVPEAELMPGNLASLELMQALVRAAAAHEHSLQLVHDDEQHRWINEVLAAGSVDGVVLAHLVEGDLRIDLLRRLGVPMVSLGRPGLVGIPDQDTGWVDIDNEAPVRAATRHLLERGHRHLDFVGFDTGAYWDLARESGYRDAMRTAGLEPRVTRTVMGADAEHAAIARALGRDPAPTAIVTGSDVLAAGVYAVAGRLGRVVGEDLAVTGFDGGVLSRLLSPTLTMAIAPFDEIASRLVTGLVRQVDGETPSAGIVLEAPIRFGQSTEVDPLARRTRPSGA